MLSTSSTQLIAVSHTVYEDVISPFRQTDVHRRAELKSEALWSRLILVISALAAVGAVEFLRAWGFTIADLAFAVYGAALGLVPPIIFTLFAGRHVTKKLSTPATWRWRSASCRAGVQPPTGELSATQTWYSCRRS